MLERNTMNIVLPSEMNPNKFSHKFIEAYKVETVTGIIVVAEYRQLSGKLKCVDLFGNSIEIYANQVVSISKVTCVELEDDKYRFIVAAKHDNVKVKVIVKKLLNANVSFKDYKYEEYFTENVAKAVIIDKTASNLEIVEE